MKKDATPLKEAENSLLHVTAHRNPHSIIELDVKTSVELTKKARELAIRAVAKSVSLPGFRKGRAPDMLVVKNFPADVAKQWEQELATLAFNEAEKLVEIPRLDAETKISFSCKSCNLEKGGHLLLSFETDPIVPEIDPKTITLKEVKKSEVTEEKIQETIRQTRFFFADWTSITDRSADEGDFVILDVDTIEESGLSSVFSKTRFEVTEKSMAAWMRKLVIGLSTGESIEGESFADETASNEDKAIFQPKKVMLHLVAIEKAALPPLDDSFAKKVGCETVAEMEQSIGKLLQLQADQRMQEALRSQVNDYLLSQVRIELPHSLIEKEVNFRMQQLFQDPEFEPYWKSLSIEERKRNLEMIAGQSAKAVSLFYICRHILNEQKIAVSLDDLSQSNKTMLDMLLSPQRPMPQNQVQRAETLSRLILEKAQDFLIAHATVEAMAAAAEV